MVRRGNHFVADPHDALNLLPPANKAPLLGAFFVRNPATPSPIGLPRSNFTSWNSPLSPL
jgi:hypothetical protein